MVTRLTRLISEIRSRFTLRLMSKLWSRCGSCSPPALTSTSLTRYCLLQDHNASIWEQLLHRNVQRFRGGPVFKAHRLCVSLNSRLESNKEEEEEMISSKHPLCIRCFNVISCESWYFTVCVTVWSGSEVVVENFAGSFVSGVHAGLFRGIVRRC